MSFEPWMAEKRAQDARERNAHKIARPAAGTLTGDCHTHKCQACGTKSGHDWECGGIDHGWPCSRPQTSACDKAIREMRLRQAQGGLF